MQLETNSVSESPVGALTLSWFWAHMKSDTIKRLFTWLWEKEIAAYTFEKPGSFKLPDTIFSLESLEERIQEAVDYISKRHDKIILIPNSITSIPFLKVAQELKDNLESLLFIAPVFNPEKAVLNELSSKNIKTEALQDEVLRNVGEMMKIKIDTKKVLEEMEELRNPDSVVPLISWVKAPIKFFMNQNDAIIDPSLVRHIWELTEREIISTSSIAWNQTMHAVPIDEVLPYIESTRVAA